MGDLTIDAGTAADIAKFEAQLARYLAGELDEDVFRVFRLNNGIYGQRQGGHNQMGGATSPPARTCSSTTCSSSRSPTSCATWRPSA
jgi:sulfite reductase beta subunit-like hemoprotein